MNSQFVTESETVLIRWSVSEVRSRRDEFFALVYQHLFAANPEYRLMFPSDSTKLIEKISTTLLLLTEAVSDLDQVNEILSELAEMHKDLGVTKAHYAAFASALAVGFQETLGSDFGQEHETAWQKFIISCGDRMLNAASK